MRISIGLVCLGIITAPCWAQSDRGTITGTVTDPAGAVVASAPVEATNADTHAVYQAATSATGNYTLSQLPTGTYSLSVTVPGFKRYLRENIELPAAQVVRIDAVLEVGAASESVTITAESPMLKTESGEMSTNVSSESLDNLPILENGTAAGGLGIRNPYAVTELLPGATFIGDSDVRVNGLPGNTQSLMVEGQDATNVTWQQTTQIQQVSIDAIQEFAVQTSNFSAEYGHTGGAVFNVTMKSGTNQFHGSAYDYFVNEFLNADVPFTPPGTDPKPTQRRNDYGATLGGPVIIPKVFNGKDKLFFFFNFEQFRETITSDTTALTVPTLAMRSGNFASILTGRQLGVDPLGRPIMENTIYDPGTTRTEDGAVVRDPFPGNIIPMSDFSPQALAIQNLVPLPQLPSPVNNYFPTIVNPRTTTIPSVKIDYNLSEKDKISVFWSRISSASPNNDGWLPVPSAVERNSISQTARINYDRTISPTLLWHAGIGLMHLNDDQKAAPFNQLTQLGIPGAQVNAFPYIEFANGIYGGLGSYFTSVGPVVLADIQNIKPTATTSLTWVKSNHTYKFGGELIIEGFPSTSGTFANNWYSFTNLSCFCSPETGLPSTFGQNLLGGNVGYPYASFLLGLVDNGITNASSDGRLGDKSVGFYAQDSWKVTRKITFDYGLRYDYQTYLQEEHGRWATFSPSTPDPAANNLPGAVIYEGNGPGRCNCDFAHNYPWAFGPRLGVAYQFAPKTVLRAGAGVMYSRTPELGYLSYTLSAFGTYSEPQFGFPATTLAQGPPISWSWPNFNPGVYTATPQNGVGTPPVYIDQNAGRPARTTEWSIGIQREITPNLMLDVAYVGNRGAWWQAGELVNPNALNSSVLAAHNINILNPADQALLLTPLADVLGTPLAAAHNITDPYPSFPTTEPVNQAIRPFPQYGNLNEIWAPLGDSWYDALQLKVTKRFSHGLSAMYSFTYQKELTDGAETSYNLFAAFTPQVNDPFNHDVNKYLSGQSIPLVSIINLIYTTPKLPGPKLVSWLLRDWQYSAYLRYQSGLPILAPSSTNQLNTLLDLSNATFMNRVPGQPLFLTNLNCGCYDPTKTLVLNPKAWANPPAGVFGEGAAYYNDYRYQRVPTENMGIGRIFRVTERVNLQIRAEFTNVFNRTAYAWNATALAATNPNAFATTNPNGTYNAGFGYINTAPGNLPPPRQGQLVARFTF